MSFFPIPAILVETLGSPASSTGPRGRAEVPGEENIQSFSAAQSGFPRLRAAPALAHAAARYGLGKLIMETEPGLTLDAINQEVYFWSKPAQAGPESFRPQASLEGGRILLIWLMILFFCLASWGAVIWAILSLFRWLLPLLH